MLDFRTETFLAVCKYMNFTKAAVHLNITQPAISQHIKYLEKIYGAKLFIRDKKHLYLTPAGKILKSALETMKNDGEILKKRILEQQEEKNSFKLGVTMTIGEYAVIPALSGYLKAHPDTDFHIAYGNTHVLTDKLRRGDIDFAMVEGNFDDANFDTRIFSSVQYAAVASANHKFHRKVNTLKDLTSERLITRESGSGTRSILEGALEIKNMSLKDFSNIVEVENIHAIVELVKQDCGISFLYKSAIEDGISEGSLVQIQLSDFMMFHDFSFIWNKGSIFANDYEKIFLELKGYAKSSS